MLNRLKSSLENISLTHKGIAIVTIPMVALIGTLILTAWFERAAQTSQDWITHTLKVKATLFEVRSILVDSETGVRGYVLYGAENYLDPYHKALTRIDPTLKELEKLVADNLAQDAAIKELKALTQVKLDSLAGMLKTPREELTASHPIVVNSRLSMVSIRKLLAKMEIEEEGLLQDRIDKNQALYNRINMSLLALFLFALLVGVIASYIVFSGILQRIRSLEGYVSNVSNRIPDEWTDKGNDEIGTLGRNVKRMTMTLLEREVALHKAHEELAKSHKDLEMHLNDAHTANKELESFSYSVSHDLRAPLRHVAGFSELMLRNSDSLDPKNKRYLDIISTSIRQMGVLIDELLAFSRMGRTALKTDRIDLNEVIDSIREELSSDTADRKIQWHIDPIPPVQGDSVMIRLVIQNLLGNALKYTREKEEAIIRIKACHNPDSEMVNVVVKDNGVGFDMTYVDKLFGVFQRLHSSEEYEGTGIGLATVRRIVTRHGGQVSAKSEVNNGAEFSFSLPIYKETHND